MKNKILGIVICTLLFLSSLSGLVIGNNSSDNQSGFDSTLNVTITPFNPPIYIPANGGTYQYTIEIENTLGNPLSFNVWTMYTLPNGSSYGPVFGPTDVELPNEWTAYRDDLTDYVQGTMPYGNYTLTVYVGTYDSDVLDSDSFNFEKIAPNAGWYPQNPGNDADLEAVSFADENNGWAVGYDTIIHTTNGGDTWSEQDDGIYYNQGYDTVDFIDNQTGWAAGSVIIKTTDGGNTWTQQYDPSGYNINDIQFVDANNGWAAGGIVDYYNSDFIRVILHTSDGGNTWSTQYYESGYYYYDYVEPFDDIFMLDNTNGWAVGGFGAVFHTNDGGNNWIEQRLGEYSELLGVSFTDLNNGWAVGEEGTMIFTNNGGTTWTNYSLGFSDYLRSIVFTDTNNGWIVGGGFYPDHATILHTSDGGSTWNIQDPGTGDFEYQLNEVDFIDQNSVWAAGGTFYPQEGVVLHTEDGGGIPVDPVLSYNPTSIDFGDMYTSEENNITLNIWNNGTGTLNYYFYPDPEDGWITTSPEGGFSEGEIDNISINIDAGGLQPGEYQTNVTIESNDGNVLLPIYVTILQANQVLSYSPHSYDFGDMEQYQMETVNLSIWNSGTGVMYYWIDDINTFCIVDPWSGSSGGEVNNHTVMCFTSSLDPGPHQCNLTIHSSGGNAIFTVYVNVVGGGLNTPPEIPTDPIPSDGAESSNQNPVLSVMVNDPNSEMMTVSFYNANDKSLIGTDLNVMSGTRAYTTWNDLSMNNSYNWYAVVHDEEDANQSNTWAFSIGEDASGPESLNVDLSSGWSLVSSSIKSPVNISELTVEYNGVDYTWSDAADLDIISNFVFGWSDQQYYTFATILRPSQGYWIFAYEPCVLNWNG
jgi:photosystem II stability/assembly factor-like uncharacterized protein